MKMTNFEKFCEYVEKLFEENNLHYEYEVYMDLFDVVISVYIDDGDWKHDHARLNYFMREKFNYEIHFSCERDCTETDGDWYSSRHIYQISKNEIGEKIVLDLVEYAE
jgi:hypothetical protein